jgi:hypothetical protein
MMSSQRKYRPSPMELLRADLKHRERKFQTAIQKAYTTAKRKGRPINMQAIRNVARELGLIENAEIEIDAINRVDAARQHQSR